jgi:hypothetical protein
MCGQPKVGVTEITCLPLSWLDRAARTEFLKGPKRTLLPRPLPKGGGHFFRTLEAVTGCPLNQYETGSKSLSKC